MEFEEFVAMPPGEHAHKWSDKARENPFENAPKKQEACKSRNNKPKK